MVDLLVLRQHMGHLITNLQVYLQLDVIEAHFDTLQHKVAQAQVLRGGRIRAGGGWAVDVCERMLSARALGQQASKGAIDVPLLCWSILATLPLSTHNTTDCSLLPVHTHHTPHPYHTPHRTLLRLRVRTPPSSRTSRSRAWWALTGSSPSCTQS